MMRLHRLHWTLRPTLSGVFRAWSTEIFQLIVVCSSLALSLFCKPLFMLLVSWSALLSYISPVQIMGSDHLQCLQLWTSSQHSLCLQAL